MRLCLDTNRYCDFMRGNPEAVALLRQAEEILLPFVVVAGFWLLSRLDPETAARIHPNDLNKTLRALEIRILRGQPTDADYAQARAGLAALDAGEVTGKVVLTV